MFVVVGAKSEKDRSVYDAAINSLCKPNELCGIMFWSDRKSAAVSLPMSEAALNAETANYIHNPFTNYTHFEWGCRIDPDPATCSD